MFKKTLCVLACLCALSLTVLADGPGDTPGKCPSGQICRPAAAPLSIKDEAVILVAPLVVQFTR